MPDSAKPKKQRLSGPTIKYMCKRVIAEFGKDGGTDHAAKMTYFLVLSIAPSLLAVFSLATLLLADVKDQIAQLIKDAIESGASGSDLEVGPAIDSTLDSLMGSATGGTIALIIGILTALWSASAYVKAYGRTANEIYEVEEGRSFVKSTGTMLLVTLAIIVGVFTILLSLLLNPTMVDSLLAPIAEPLGISGLVSFLSTSFLPIWNWIKWPIIVLIAFVMVSLLYWAGPNVKKPFRLISPGGVFAIVGIALAAVGLSIYMATVAGYSSYGAIGGIMAVLFALWVINIVIIMGAEVDAEFQRAQELEAGKAAEEKVAAPLRDESGVIKAEKKRENLISDARDIRLQHLHRADRDYTSEEHRLTPRNAPDSESPATAGVGAQTADSADASADPTHSSVKTDAGTVATDAGSAEPGKPGKD